MSSFPSSFDLLLLFFRAALQPSFHHFATWSAWSWMGFFGWRLRLAIRCASGIALRPGSVPLGFRSLLPPFLGLSSTLSVSSGENQFSN